MTVGFLHPQGGDHPGVETMRLLALAAVLFLVAAFAVAPTASAEKMYCIEGDGTCHGGELVCVVKGGKKVACVPDPCYTTMCW